ncbi:glycoprotein 3-alpha-L-fucosyltransferase A-like [Watersipora subatra]|uniref:glycoprotein 3-alpha-L-fucosyltransferase A-like n=1 Tax=Watersipora subatra TaxID=2589382 RepID=UPI00355B0D0E
MSHPSSRHGFFFVTVFTAIFLLLYYSHARGYLQFDFSPPVLPFDILIHNITNTSSERVSATKHVSFNQTLRNTDNTTKEIVMPSRMDGVFCSSAFKMCPVSNCVYKFSDRVEEMTNSHLVVIEFSSSLVGQVDLLRTLWKHPPLLVYSHESPGYKKNLWRTSFNNFDGVISYETRATVYYPYSVTAPIHPRTSTSQLQQNYAKDKRKGAFAYVSNCKSIHYNRMAVMRQLAKYIDVDIYGSCTGNVPCSRADAECEAAIHKQYRFYLAFENSLCKDYVTEKFWKTLVSPGHFVPVVIGGLSIDEYTSIAPDNSFIHAYNFTSIARLGTYLQKLMNDDVVYNRYHAWKTKQKIDSAEVQASCDLCSLTHNPGLLTSKHMRRWADEWNDAKKCMNFALK